MSPLPYLVYGKKGGSYVKKLHAGEIEDILMWGINEGVGIRILFHNPFLLVIQFIAKPTKQNKLQVYEQRNVSSILLIRFVQPILYNLDGLPVIGLKILRNVDNLTNIISLLKHRLFDCL